MKKIMFLLIVVLVAITTNIFSQYANVKIGNGNKIKSLEKIQNNLNQQKNEVEKQIQRKLKKYQIFWKKENLDNDVIALRSDSMYSSEYSQKIEPINNLILEADNQMLVSANENIDDYHGTSLSARNGARAYATVKNSQGNYEIKHALAENMASKNSNDNIQINSDNGVGNDGFIGKLKNYYRVQTVTARIQSTEPGTDFNKTFIIGPGQTLTGYLLPGTYHETTYIGNELTGCGNFEVRADQTHSFLGEEIYWGITIGARRW